MLKLFSGLLFFYCATNFAMTISCPTVSDIKNGEFKNWLPLYIDGEELASLHDVAQFQKYVTQFAIAKWNTSYLESAHCFYSGDGAIVNQIVLAQDAWRPVNDTHWSWIKINKIAECSSTQSFECSYLK